jgi:hypothetical protein
MVDQAFNHGRYLGVGETLGLRVDAYRVGFNVLVNHDAIAPITRPPLGHGILFPALEAGTIRRTTTAALVPDFQISQSQEFIYNGAVGVPKPISHTQTK